MLQIINVNEHKIDRLKTYFLQKFGRLFKKRGLVQKWISKTIISLQSEKWVGKTSL